MIGFKGHHFEDTTILMSVRWYLAYPLSYRQIEELITERGVDVDHILHLKEEVLRLFG